MLILSLAACLGFSRESEEKICLLFVGDILLSRNVSAEINKTRKDPWGDFHTLFGNADWVGGNLEGAVGSEEECTKSSGDNPCFAIPRNHISLLSRAGFRTIINENNHADDLGSKGRQNTKNSLEDEGLQVLDFENSPMFLEFDDVVVGIVALSTIPNGGGERMSFPNIETLQKLRLARALSDVVLVSIHWGSELLDWPNKDQREKANWLIEHGADVILGHHPHVVQTCECINNRPVFFSLGNHLFDQKYPATKQGLIANLVISDRVLYPGALKTRTGNGTFMPILEAGDSEIQDVFLNCHAHLHTTLNIAGINLKATTVKEKPSEEQINEPMITLKARSEEEPLWRSRAMPLVSAEIFHPQDSREGLLFTLERHYSPLDSEMGIRPYVYQISDHGITAKWRGSAMAWPLLDALFLPGKNSVLCGLHRGDSFMAPNQNTQITRTAIYKWNGFGFSGIDNPVIAGECRAYYENTGVIER
jgi:hypothetical protein